jgi:cleavage stimulation factor subunit 1
MPPDFSYFQSPTVNYSKMVDEEQNHAVLSLIVSQLKEFGYYSAAKTIADSIGRNPDASNKLLDLLKDQNLQVEVEPVIKEIPSDFFQYDKTAATKQCPPFTTWFTTQHREGVRAAAFSYDGTFIATGSHDTSLKVLDADAIIRQHSEPNDDKKVVKTLYDHTGPVNEVKFHPNGAVLASCSGIYF